jgi:hypothetical protein
VRKDKGLKFKRSRMDRKKAFTLLTMIVCKREPSARDLEKDMLVIRESVRGQGAAARTEEARRPQTSGEKVAPAPFATRER